MLRDSAALHASTSHQKGELDSMFAGIMWLLAIVDDELCYKRSLPQIELLIF